MKVFFTAAAVKKFHRKHGGYLIVDPRVQDGTVGTFDGIADFEFDVEVDWRQEPPSSAPAAVRPRHRSRRNVARSTRTARHPQRASTTSFNGSSRLC